MNRQPIQGVISGYETILQSSPVKLEALQRAIRVQF